MRIILISTVPNFGEEIKINATECACRWHLGGKSVNEWKWIKN